MKKLIFSVFVLISALVFVSCSDDDDNGDSVESVVENPVEGDLSQLVINEFSASGNWVELHNQSDGEVDALGLVLCLGPATYVDIEQSIVIEGETTVPAGGFLVVNYNLTEGSGGLALYVDRSGFTNPDTILDFVQYGDAGSVRESVAVEAGIWVEGDFVPNVGLESSSFAYDGEGNGSGDWSEALNPTVGAENGI